jgi:amino acid transporter
MAARGLLPAPLARLHRRHATPWVSIVVNALGVALLIPFSFQELIQVDMFLYAAALILEFAALVWLRLKEPGMTRPYRVPGGLTGAVALSVPPVALCVLSIALADLPTVSVSAGGIVLGLLIYAFVNRRYTRPARTEATAPR